MKLRRNLIVSALLATTTFTFALSSNDKKVEADNKLKDKKLTEGKEYVKLSFENDKQSDFLKQMIGEKEFKEIVDKKQKLIVEFFWYGCPHCFTMEKTVKEFMNKTQDVKIVRYPVSFPRWVSGTEIFFALKNLNLLEKYHDDVFSIIHVNGINILDNEIARKGFFERKANIMIAEQIEKELKSDRVKKQVELSKKVIEFFQVKSTPLFAIQNIESKNTLMVSPGSSGGYQQTIDNLVQLMKK